MKPNELSDDDLLSRLHAFCVDSRRLDARVIVLLIEVEERRLHLASAHSSLFDFCLRRLGMSEGAAFRRINAARLVRRFPILLDHVESGGVHLSTLVLLRDHLTEANVDELVDAASGKTKREVEELLARRAPRPDVRPTIRKLPSPSAPAASMTSLSLPAAAPQAPAAPARIEPLSAARYKLQMTASVELRDKLERARDLMRHRNPNGDLAVVVERALDALLEKLEKERLGKTTQPGRTARPAKPGRISRAVRREVFERDGEQCTFVDAHDHRCPARAFLELDHIKSRALDGKDDAANLRVFCRAHNLLHAEEVFGRTHVARQMHFRQRKSPASATVPEPTDAPTDAARRGLVNLGFRDPDARRAVQVVCGRHGEDLTLGELLREALSVLTASRGTP
jgi:hypothetical protein